MIKKEQESLILRFLYRTLLGRIILKILITPIPTKLMGMLMNSKISKLYIPHFIKKNHIDTSNLQESSYKSFNAFFTRKKALSLKTTKKFEFISPSDGMMSIYKIENNLKVRIKGSIYSVSSLLQNEELAKNFKNGLLLVIRLSPKDYHRYCYIDDGTKEENRKINGKFHTVRSIALDTYPVFHENAREYTLLHTKHFKKVIQMEVGALFVGKIINFHEAYQFHKGEEKGYFEFGGSTICLFLEENSIKLDSIYEQAQIKKEEIPVFIGQRIGKKI